jgi:hypothetical protein
MADASALGIYPPATVRIDMGGWVQDWPWDTVKLTGNAILIRGYTGRVKVSHCLRDPLDIGEQGLCYYPYEHAQPCCTAHATGRFYPPIAHPPAWVFHGSETFTVTAGPPQAPSVN